MTSLELRLINVPDKKIRKNQKKCCPYIDTLVGGRPFVRFAGCGLTCGAPDILPILYVGIKAAPVRRKMEKAVMVDPPDLGGLVKSHAAPCLGDHGMESAVSQVIHPWRGGVVFVKSDFSFSIMKLIHFFSPYIMG